jgi:hypothetical protein
MDYVGTVDCENLDDALDYAYEMAVEEYESYAGYHGIPSWEELEQEIRDEFDAEIEAGEYDESDIESYTQDRWNEEIQNWIQYTAIPFDEDKKISDSEFRSI